MGNTIGGSKRRTAKLMKVDGETIKLKSPLPSVRDILRDNPSMVLMDSDDVRRLGVRARPMLPEQALLPRKVYFLVELPRPPIADRNPRRAVSGLLNSTTAKERLEGLMLAKRSVSDLSFAATSARRVTFEEPAEKAPEVGVRLKVRLPKAQVAKLVEESRDAAEAAERIMKLCAEAGVAAPQSLPPQMVAWRPELGRIEEMRKFL
ncbi:Uncharacterized protein QJS10_CPA06g02215 [Acorus calamus]|uniref:Uncharacterized protein n=1 Tax=Acorus calamus TaxID=4465 RepID=A0AAV9EL36_ACOCL|nr:Uncharacterized protein QJS10_CPA06g02215 [Acorus calamus]